MSQTLINSGAAQRNESLQHPPAAVTIVVIPLRNRGLFVLAADLLAACNGGQLSATWGELAVEGRSRVADSPELGRSVTWDFGEVYANSHSSGEVVVRNTGRSSIRLESVSWDDSV